MEFIFIFQDIQEFCKIATPIFALRYGKIKDDYVAIGNFTIYRKHHRGGVLRIIHHVCSQNKCPSVATDILEAEKN